MNNGYKCYNPIRTSPKKFYEKFSDGYDNWQEFGFMKDKDSLRKIKSDFKSSFRIMYKGRKSDAYAIVSVFPYSSKKIYSREEKHYIGSVMIASFNIKDINKAKYDLEKLTRIRLKEVQNKMKGGNRK